MLLESIYIYYTTGYYFPKVRQPIYPVLLQQLFSEKMRRDEPYPQAVAAKKS
jgi:hypothetical protein